MKSIFKIATMAFCGSVLAACVTPQAYVDPQFHKASYESVQRVAVPIPVSVNAQFQRNGQPLPAADSELRNDVERTLRASGVFAPSAEQGVPTTISVVANNIADVAAARAKGFGTGLTFGAAGSMVDDNYEFTFSYRAGSGQERKATYQHAIHTAIGHTERPAGLTPMTLSEAFNRVVEDSVLNFVKDLQSAGLAMK